MNKHVLAIDIGASSGRVMLVSFDGMQMSLKELHRFSNVPVLLGDTMHWDFLRLFQEIKTGLLKAKQYGEIISLGIDTWGVDFGLIDRYGRLMENPVHYRDGRTRGLLKESFKKIDEQAFYELTGNQFMEINTAFQLMAVKKYQTENLERAKAMLLMPDLFQYFLSGEMHSESSIASTTQLFDMRQQKWSYEIMKKLELPVSIFQPILSGGSRSGQLRSAILNELGLKPMTVVSVAGHDTQSAMAAIPEKADDFIFISCGTWSLFGTELSTPIMNQKSKQYNITNEVGIEGRYSFLKNIIGLWLIQESRQQWLREGREYNFGELEKLAGEAEGFASLINPDAPELIAAGDIPRRIQAICQRTNQRVPLSPGEVVRCVNESLALKYRMALEEVMECTGKEYQTIHLVGGGAQSAMLCQMTANACQRQVAAGPVEATVFGNAAVQFMTDGVMKNLKDARQIIRNSVDVVLYEPQEPELWESAYRKFKDFMQRSF